MGPAHESGRIVGRYALYDEIASGGMATIHLGRLLGQVGFARTVAIKRLHPHFAKDPEFVAMFIDEARLAAGVRHPNVVATLDVVALEGELFLVMEYIEGDSLSHLVRDTLRSGAHVPPGIASAVVSNLLYGLHAAHVAKDDRGEPLHIVHRDVSPQNVLVGIDGVARVLDFGVAKASRRMLETEAGRIKGKFRYMAPEQIRADHFDHRVDVFAAGTLLWEVLTGRGLFQSDEPMRTMSMVLEHPIPPPSSLAPGVEAVDAVVLRALERDPERRYPSAREFAMDLEKALPPAVPRVVGEWVESFAGHKLQQRSARLIEIGSETGAAALDPAAVSSPSPGLSEAAHGPSRPLQPSASELVAGAASAPSSASAARHTPAQMTPLPTPAPSSLRTEPSSQVSEVSTAAWDTAAARSMFPAAKRSMRALLIGVVAALGLFVVVLAILVIRSQRPGRETEPDVVGIAPSADLPRAAAPGPVAPPNPAPVATAVAIPRPVAATPSAAPEAEAEPKPELEPVPKVEPKPEPPQAKPQAAQPPSVPVTKPAADCNPPYTIDKDGIKKFKRHCM